MKTTLLLPIILLLLACTGAEVAPPDCTAPTIQIAPTAIHASDPDLSQPPQQSSDAGDGSIYCPTPIATSIAPAADNILTATEVVNLSLDSTNQELVTTAVGDDMLAVAWLTDGDIYVAFSKGGNHFQVRRVDAGISPSLTFSPANRLHLAYEQDGNILYRSADQGIHPAETDSEIVAFGTNPTVILNQYQYAQIVFENAGILHHAAQQQTGHWQIASILAGTNPTFTSIGNGLDLTYYIAYSGAGGHVQLAKWKTTPYGFFPNWQPLTQLTIPLTQERLGRVQIAGISDQNQTLLTATWVVKELATNNPIPAYSIPTFSAVNPFYPTQIGNPDHIYAGLNAIQFGSQITPFNAGIYQTVHIPNPTANLVLTGYGVTDATPDANLTLQVGIDPNGGTNPDSPTVVWSNPTNAPTFTPISVNTTANGHLATLFLHATQNNLEMPAFAIFDQITFTNGDLQNGDFEEAFTTTPTHWTPYHQDSTQTPLAGRDRYAIYAIWSEDGGTTWTPPALITENRDGTGSLTGAIRPQVFPFITSDTTPTTTHFLYLYESGDPPPDSDFIRFGRPFVTSCDNAGTNCTDAPGTALLSRDVIRPSFNLSIHPDPFQPNRLLLAWDSLQADHQQKDVYITYGVVR